MSVFLFVYLFLWSKRNNLNSTTAQLGTPSKPRRRRKQLWKTKGRRGWIIARHVHYKLCVYLSGPLKRQTRFLLVTASGQKWFYRKAIQTAHEGEKNTTNASINISFNFIEIFRLRCNLDMQFSELYSWTSWTFCSSHVNNYQPRTHSFFD